MRSMCSPTANDEDAHAQMKAPIRSLFFCPGPVSTEGAKGGKSAVSGARRHGVSRKTRAPDLAGWTGAVRRSKPHARARRLGPRGSPAALRGAPRRFCDDRRMPLLFAERFARRNDFG